MAVSARPARTTFSAWLHELARFSDEPVHADPPFADGDCVLGRYDVRRLLGRGGMGFVYEVYDRACDVTCALKTLRELAPDRIVMLKHEFRAIGRVHHTNLVRPGELLEEHGRWLFTMELVRGEDPVTWVGGDESRLRHVIVGLADVLAAMHEQGVVHRDVKPSNVIVGAGDRVVLLDLGIAHDRARPSRLHDRAAGTAAYMAPEATCGPLDPAADMYSLGVLLYELATGQLAFDEHGDQLAVRKRDPSVRPSLTEARPQIARELDELYTALLAVDPRSRPPAREVVRRLRGEAAVHAATPQVLVGREVELRRLRGAFEAACAANRSPGPGGPGAAVFVHGPSGIGKTALVERFLASAGARVLAGRCYERETVPYKALDGIIDAIADALARDPGVHAIVPAGCALLARVFPVLATSEAFAARDAPPEVAGDQREHLAIAFRALLVAFAEHHPLVVFIDDLQFADEDGLALLARALQPPVPSLLLIATTRAPERPPALTNLEGASTIELGPLAPDDARRLAFALLGGVESARIARIVEESGGSPFLIGEISASRPGRDRDAIAVRCDALDRELREVLELVVVAGAPLAFAILQAAASTPIEMLQHHVHALEGHRLARSVGAGAGSAVDTFHDRVREVLLARLAPSVLAELHGRIADAFARTRPDAHAQIAVHAAGAGRTAIAYRHARIAADRAGEGLAYGHAAELYRLALAVADDTPPEELHALRVRRARALAMAWCPLEAAQAFVEAAASAQGAESRGLQMQAVEQSLFGGDLELGLRELDRALRESKIRTPRRAWSALATALVRRLQLRLQRLRWRRARDVTIEVDLLYSAAMALAMIDAMLALGYHSRALLLALDLRDPDRLSRSLQLEACIHAGSGSFDEAARLIAQADELAAEAPTARAIARAPRIVLAVQLGRWEEGLALGEAPDRAGFTPWHIAASELYMAHCELNLGRFVELAERCARTSRQVHERHDRFLELAMSVSFAPVVELAHGDLARARAIIERGKTLLWGGGRGGYFHALAAVSALFVDLYAGDHEQALAVWRGPGSTLLARKSHYGRVYLQFLGANAALGTSCTRRDRSLRVHVARAIRRLARDPVPWARPYGQLLAAQVAHLDDRPEARDRALAAARADFDGFGAGHMVDIVDRLAGGAKREAAELRLRVRGVVDPVGFARMLSPAFR